ncbi:hypothetical protein RB653_005764 [Dictyostelium firmibasis]|uniref:Helicase ATP-binding domain-containing protein n=1 Tax=Dictyostelium firmibasis TaxID=79012 RepID=A0AAN7U875_9MYCE
MKTPIIRIGNIQSYLKNVDKSTLITIGSKMKFNKPYKIISKVSKFRKLFFMSPKSFFNQKTGAFKTGLLPIVSSHLKDLNIGYQHLDEREPLPQLFENWNKTIHNNNNNFNINDDINDNDNQENDDDDDDEIQLQPKMIDSDFLSDVDVILHDYQVDSVNFALSNHRGIIKCATGGGKTLILAAFIKALGSDVPVVILVSKRSLVTQIYNVLKELNICKAGRVSSDFLEVGMVTISTVRSTHKIPEQVKNCRALIVDEVHEFSGPFSQKVFQQFENAYCRLGFSATPFKQDDPVHNHYLTSVFGTLLCDITTKELTKINILSEAVIHFYPIKRPVVKVEPGSHFQIMENLLISENKYLNDSIVKIIENIESGRVMILVKRLSHGDELFKLLPNAYWIKGDDDQQTREHVIKKLRESDPNKKVIAIFSSIGNVGLDVKIHHLINACGGKDPNMTIQKLGRGLRRADDKTHLDYHDFNFSYKVNKALNDHSKARINTLKNEGHQVILEEELIPLPNDGSKRKRKSSKKIISNNSLEEVD